MLKVTDPVRALQCSPPIVPRVACTRVAYGIHYLQRFRTSTAVRFLLSLDFKLEETCTETPAGLAELQELLMQQVKVCVCVGGGV